MARTKKSTYERLMSGPLNRQQRRELARRLKTEDPGLEIVNRNVAGIDVGNESHFVAVAPSRDTQPVRSEERRVGEEGRSRWSPYHLKKKKQKKQSARLCGRQKYSR